MSYKPLGIELKNLREHKRESVAEVSGAVEIDELTLQKIEEGSELPSEDVLMLLMNHFGVNDKVAAKLWQLAGYDKTPETGDNFAQAAKHALMVMIDPRIMYSDNVEVVANPQGMVLNFSQNNGTAQPMIVSRIGMSHGQAKVLMGVLHRALYELDNPRPRRQLPPPEKV